ncbi:unnamed protein product [Phytophthora fragariaefolia]|uniref:Unnamed protein product n=1 Tax=Phytophthora fragariaefolia TaxID=1490495 RepID=A0A9W6XUI8_9STRA|nr:unnamed protein product [Phytophthora fragariaefolia]
MLRLRDLANVEFYPLGGNAEELAVYIVKNDGCLILTKIETLEKVVPRNMQMIDEILDSMTDLKIEDTEARVLNYFVLFDQIVEEHGLCGMLGSGREDDANYGDHMKLRCKLLMKNIAPEMLRLEMERLAIAKPVLKKNDIALYEALVDRARDQQHYQLLAQELKQGERTRSQNKNNVTGKSVDMNTRRATAMSPSEQHVKYREGRQQDTQARRCSVTCATPRRLYVMDGDTNEVFIGDETLKSLSINVDQLPEQLVGKADPEEDEDNIEEEVLVGTTSEDEIRELLDLLLANAINEGFRMNLSRSCVRLDHPDSRSNTKLLVVIAMVNGAYYFATFDLFKGFWQLLLHPDCRESFSFITNDTVYTPTRVPQGATDSPIHFQSQMHEVFRDMLYENVIIWVDDIVVFAKPAEEFIAVLRKFFSRIHEYGLKLNAKKSCLYAREISWCGHIIDDDGLRHNPERVAALSSLLFPATVAGLQKYCAL